MRVLSIKLFYKIICISYPLKVFQFDTGILRDSCAVPFLKTFSRLLQGIDFLCLTLFIMFACNIFSFRVFLTMNYWKSTEVLLNLIAPLDSTVPFLEFEQINVFWTSGFDSVRIVFGTLSASRSLLQLYFSQFIYVSLLLLWENQYTVHGIDSISIAQFPAMICSVSANGSLNRVAPMLFSLCAFYAWLPLSSA